MKVTKGGNSVKRKKKMDLDEELDTDVGTLEEELLLDDSELDALLDKRGDDDPEEFDDLDPGEELPF